MLVAGTDAGPPELKAPVECTPTAGLPFARLEARAAANGTDRSCLVDSEPRVRGWAVFREEVRADGSIARTGPEIVPSSESAAESFRYAFLDRGRARDVLPLHGLGGH